MRKCYLCFLILFIIIFVDACSSSNIPTGNAVAQQNFDTGVNKGQLPPDFTITTIDGKQYKLSEFRKESKPVLLYFWASWCPYCSKDFDVVKNIYPNYADKVTFLAIDLDLNENERLIRSYKERKGLSGIDFAAGKADVLSDYAIKYTTTKYAIGKDGLILYKGSGVFNEQQWEVLFNGMINS